MDGLSDLAFFTALLRAGSLAALAREQGVTPPVISRRLAALEARLGLRLLQRTTRRMHLTQEGELYAQRGQALLDELYALEADVAARHLAPRGLLRVNASFGFGRCHIAPAVSDFARCYPQVGVQLTLTDRPMNLVETGLDLGIRVGACPIAATMPAGWRPIVGCCAPRPTIWRAARRPPRRRRWDSISAL